MDMTLPGFDHFALRYLSLWEGSEKAIHASMSGGNPSPDGLRRAMHGFRIARSFSGIGNAQARTRVLRYISSAGKDGRRSVNKLTNSFRSDHDFGKENLSAASKLLWLSHREPFLIYDANAVVALEELWLREKGTKIKIGRDYGKFEDVWRSEYAKVEREVVDASNRLNSLLPYFDHCLKEDSLRELTERKWFRERVFDNYLWFLGGQMLAKRKRT